MKKAKMMKKYADLIATVGIGANSKQDVVIKAPVEAYQFVRYLSLELYNNKCRSVKVDWKDSQLDKQNLMHMSLSRLDEIQEWEKAKEIERTDKSYAMINLIGEDPSAFKSVNSDKLKRRNKAVVNAFQPLKKPYHNNELAWCIAAVPTKGWAKRIFPKLSPTQAVVKLWDAIYEACYIDEKTSPIENWEKHISLLQSRSEKLNNYNFKELHYTNKLGTDFTVGLAKNHIWCSARAIQTRNGLPFVPNLPTQEIFTMPDNHNINGRVYSARPLSTNGVIVDKFWIEFKNGKAVAFDAEEGKQQLEEIINFDEGSSSLGEVALIPYDSPISKQGIIYQETLFDENASCHLALGQSFNENLKNADNLSEEQLKEVGANQSLRHVDFMVGTKDLNIDGIDYEGNVIPVFRNGNFVF